VLIADDESAVRATLSRLLGAFGYEVTAFPDGSQALDHYRRQWQNIDVVILDMIMPVMSGRETFQALRAINPDVRVLLASGYALDEETQLMLAEGVADFLQKPYAASTLSVKLDALLGASASA
jgi:CheY-like chemotaxis protein